MQNEKDRRFMRQALRLAARGIGHTRPNPVVGCVIVQTDHPASYEESHATESRSTHRSHTKKRDRVVGKGFHPRAGEAHAEVLALRQTMHPSSNTIPSSKHPPSEKEPTTKRATQAHGATVYVTLEPCSHHGRTPPCADALIQAGVARVVVAMLDPNPHVSGKGVQRLQEAGIAVTVGVCAEEASTLNQPFVTWITQGRPMVTLKMAASLDGKTATRHGESQWITGPVARRYVHKMRAQHDIVMVGIGTVLADNPRLNCRLPTGHTSRAYRDPIRLVLDSTLKMPHHAAILTSSTTAALWIATTERSTMARREALSKRGVHLLLCNTTSTGRVDLTDLLNQLGKLGILSILSEAGGTLNAALLEVNLADRLALFLAPKLIGGQMAAGLIQGEGVDLLTNAHRLTKLHVTPVGEDLLLEGALLKKCSPV